MNENTNEEFLLNFEIVLATLRYTRQWHAIEQGRYPFHPVIKELMKKFKPVDHLLLALEYPHQSVRDASNVAYTQNERSGIADRQTVTTFGRYIRRHFPDMKDHEVRDYATKCIGDIFEIWETSDDIVRSVQLGPKSCMTWESSYTPGLESYNKSLLHPYRVYEPSLGWKVVVRLDPNTRQINGRALVNHTEDGKKIFVRSYKRGSDYSYADEAMEMWLREDKYEHLCEWPTGTKLAHIPHRNTVLAPYIDGENQRVTQKGDYLVIDDRGEYECTCTDGVPYGDDNDRSCDSCEVFYDEDDMYWVDDGDHCVCEVCRDEHYVEATTRYGTEYYRREDCIETESGDWYHVNSYVRLGVVELKDGSYEHESNCIVDSEGDWVIRSIVENDDGYVILNNVAYQLDEVFLCHKDSTYYILEFNECVLVDGLTYHVDNAPETVEEGKDE